MAARFPLPRTARIQAPSKSSVAWVAIAGLALAATMGAIMLAGTKTGAALALLAVAGPICAYAAFRAPLIFPFGIFVLLVPFDNVLSFSSAGTVTRAVAIVAGAAVAFWLLRTRKYITPDRSLLWWIAFYLWAVTSLTWALDPMFGMAHVWTTLQLLSLFGAISLMPVDRRTLAMVVAAVIASGAIGGVVGGYLFHHGIDVSKNNRLFIQSDDSTIDPNQFAAALILPFCLALSAVVRARTFISALLLGFAVIAIAAGIAVAGSRGAILAIGVAFLYLLIRSRKRIALAAFGLGGLAVALAAFSNALMRFSNATSTGGAGRGDIWKVGLAAFREHPIFGSGFSNFPLAYDHAFLSVSETYYTRWHRAPHNLIIQTSVELGIIGTIILLTAWWKSARSLKVIPPESTLYSLRVALEAAMIGLFVSALFLDMVQQKYIWVALIVVALARNAELVTRKTLTGRPIT